MLEQLSEQTKVPLNESNVLGSFFVALIISSFSLAFAFYILTNIREFSLEQVATLEKLIVWKIIIVYSMLSLVAGVYFLFWKRLRTVIFFLALFLLTVTASFVFLTDIAIPLYAPQASSPHVTADLPPQAGEKVVTFDWNYRGKKYSLEERLFDSYYQFYKTLPVSAPESPLSQAQWYTTYNEMFIAGARADDTVPILAEKLRALGEKNKLDENQLVELVATFVQTIPYDQGKLDRRTSGQNGVTEKITYPYEVLYENTGVCQDKSYLAYGLLKALGYGVAIFLFPNPEDNHMAVGVECPLEYSNYASGYCFLETTSLGNKIGMIPELIPQSRIATSDVEITAIGTGDTKDTEYQALGNVEILNRIDGKEYTGIIATISTQKELERLRKSIAGYKQELAVQDAKITNTENDLEAMKKRLKKLEKDEEYDDYNDLVEKYNKLLAQLKKDIKTYNEKVSAQNVLITRYNTLAKSFYE